MRTAFAAFLLLLLIAGKADAADAFANQAPQLNSPAGHAVPITPADGADLATNCRYVYVGGAGNLIVYMALEPGTSARTFTGVPVGTVLPIRVRRVLATGTTATALMCLW